jgi:anti-sigma factor ChrR (cupin superfamily)
MQAELHNPSMPGVHNGSISLQHLLDAAKLSTLEWQPFREAVDQYPLYIDATPDKSGPSAKLLRLHPGCKIPFHIHSGYEHIITLDGTHHDRSGQSQVGTILINKPNSGHRATCESGAVILAIYEKPVCFCDESQITNNADFHDDYLVFHDIFDISRLHTLHWEPSSPGICESPVYHDDTLDKIGPSSKFLRLAPGARELCHEHTGYEHMLLIDGSLMDEGVVHGPGTLIIHEPFTTHHTMSETGCTALVIYEKPTRLPLEKKVEQAQ